MEDMGEVYDNTMALDMDMVRCMIMPDSAVSNPFVNNFHVSKLLLYILYINLSIVRYTHLSLADTTI